MSRLMVVAALILMPSFLFAAKVVSLDKKTYKSDQGVVLLHVNWGRSWKCGQYENAQIESLTFEKLPLEAPKPITLKVETPSKLRVNDEFLPYALVVQPGEYALTAFDVKVAQSASLVGHLKGSKENLLQDGKPIGGLFSIGAGEIVYVGHFGLDCSAEPFLWRYYIESKEDFDRYVGGFRKRFEFTNGAPVEFRLFSTQMFGKEFSLPTPNLN